MNPPSRPGVIGGNMPFVCASTDTGIVHVAVVGPADYRHPALIAFQVAVIPEAVERLPEVAQLWLEAVARHGGRLRPALDELLVALPDAVELQEQLSTSDTQKVSLAGMYRLGATKGSFN